MQVLVVEDDPDLRASLEWHLSDAGYAVTAAGSAEEALGHAAGAAPDLVLLDVMLPDEPGLSVCRALRTNPATSDVPVIMISARRGEADRVVGLEHGADDYVEKPFSMRELLLRIDAVVKRSRRPPLLVRASPEAIAEREQLREWNTFASGHFARGEWAECQEICRAILRRYHDDMVAPERAALYDRIRACGERLRALGPSSP